MTLSVYLVESKSIEWGQDLIVDVVNSHGELLKNMKYTLIRADGEEMEGDTGHTPVSDVISDTSP